MRTKFLGCKQIAKFKEKIESDDWQFHVHTKAHITIPANTGCERKISIIFHVFFSKYGNPVSDESSPRLNFSTAGPEESNRARNLLSNCCFSPLLEKIGK